MEKYIKIFKDNGYKFTPQRRAVLKIIAFSKEKHLTTEEIYNVVKKANPGIGIATVYRTLQILEEILIIKKDYLGTGVVRYEINNPKELHSHHHMVCLDCGKILEAKEDLMSKIEKMIEKNYSFRVTDHSIKFFGYCGKCSNT